MLYRVLIDGIDVLDFNDQRLVLLSPQLNVELDTSGAFEFTVPPNHLYYDMFAPENILKMTVEVFEDDVLHWFGRPIEYHLDFYKNKKINCEGALAYFNDSIIRSEEWDQTPLSTIFASVIAEHNSMVPSNRQFSVGNFTVPDRPVYRKFNYEQTFDVLKSKFLDAEEGHFFVRRENGVNYIDFLKDMPYTCNQDVEFAENLLNFTYNFDAKDFATCVIPLGGTDQETGLPIDIKSVNGGSDILVGNSAANYGNIVKVQQYSDIEDPSELIAEGQKYLTTLQYNAFLIECSAIDLHSKDGSMQQFRVGQMVNCVSNPHGVQLSLPISKMTLYLDSAAKQITLGRIPKKTLSRFYKEKISDGSGSGGTIEAVDEIPEGWAVIPPDEDGGSPTLKKIPIAIQVTHQPLQINYTQENRIFDINGLEVKAVATARPLTYFSDERYPTGVIPHSELSFYASNGTQYYSLVPNETNVLLFHKAKILVGIRWYCPYDNKKHIASFYITDKVQEAIDSSLTPDHIVIEKPPTQLEYYDGDHINMSGAKVVAYMANGEPYNASGYENGVIPNTELTLIPAVADIDSAHYTNEITQNDYTVFTADAVTWSYPFGTPGGVHGDHHHVVNMAQVASDCYLVGYGTILMVISKNQIMPEDFQTRGISYYEDGYITDTGWLNQSGDRVGSYVDDDGNIVEYHYNHSGTTYYEDPPRDGWTISLPRSYRTRDTIDGPVQDYYGFDLDTLAKIIFENEPENRILKQNIQVLWKLPNSEDQLAESFEIELKEGGRSGSR